jgi:hypothetical protein
MTTPALALEEHPSDYARYRIWRPEDFIAGWSLDLSGAQRFAQGAAINTDDRNQLATRSAGLGAEALRARQLNKILSRLDPLASRTGDLEFTYLVQRLVTRSEVGRAVKLAKSQPEPAQRSTNLGWAASGESSGRAAKYFRAALKLDPTAQSARFGLLVTKRRAVEANDPEVLELAEPLEGVAAAVVSGWRLAAAGEWPALRELEPELASADWVDPTYRDAQRLRIRWRVASDDPALHAEGAEIARILLRISSIAEDLLLGAKALATANQGDSALQVMDSFSSRKRRPGLVRAGVELVDSLPPEVDPTQRAVIRNRLVRRRAAADDSVNGE